MAYGAPPIDYVQALRKERDKLDPFRSVIPLACKLIDDEIDKLLGRDPLGAPLPYEYAQLTSANGPPPPTGGEVVQKEEKIYIPKTGFNFVGRMLGPGGSTMKGIEASCRCKMMIRGEGSMRIKGDEEKKKGQPGYEHLNEPLHVLISVHLPENEAEYYLRKAVDIVNTLLVPPEAEDTLDPVKKNQLRELDLQRNQHRMPPANYPSPYMDPGVYGNPYLDVPPPDYGYPYPVSATPLLPAPYYG
eukprot:Phypoly_transcript_09711.p1 GENE.Phypoly_transcript_09711~~Phypoly_transcript_09711.p1  ORF type:complete len:261 (+),score=45.92 Phypoly_transcript_09711:50-784(+)